MVLRTAIALAQSESERIDEVSASFDALLSNMTTIEESFQHNISTVNQMQGTLSNMIQRLTDRSDELETLTFKTDSQGNRSLSVTSEDVRTGMQSLQTMTDALSERMKTMIQVKSEREAHLVCIHRIVTTF